VASFKYHSEENVSVAVSESSPPVSLGAQCSPQFGPVAPQYHLQPRAATDEPRATTNDHNITLSLLKQLEQGREMQTELQDVIADLQVYILPLYVPTHVWIFLWLSMEMHLTLLFVD